MNSPKYTGKLAEKNPAGTFSEPVDISELVPPGGFRSFGEIPCQASFEGSALQLELILELLKFYKINPEQGIVPALMGLVTKMARAHGVPAFTDAVGNPSKEYKKYQIVALVSERKQKGMLVKDACREIVSQGLLIDMKSATNTESVQASYYRHFGSIRKRFEEIAELETATSRSPDEIKTAIDQAARSYAASRYKLMSQIFEKFGHYGAP